MRLLLVRATFAALMILAGPRSSRGDDWPCFRGPEGTGLSKETGLRRPWPEGGPGVVWRQGIGSGFSGIAVVGERFFTSFTEDQEFVGAFGVANGEELWRHPLGSIFRDPFGDGPRSTPAVSDGVVYALGGQGRLVAVRQETGEAVWEIELTEKHPFLGPQMTATGPAPRGDKAMIPSFGYATSPLIEGDLLIFEAGTGEGKTIVALDKATGETRWTALDDQGITYSSAAAATIAGRRQILVNTMTGLVSLDPATGKTNWSYPWALAVAQPVLVDSDKIFVSTANISGAGNPDVEAMLLEVVASAGGLSASPLWQSHVMRNHWNSSVAYQGSIYGFDNATFRCLDLDGNTRWAQRGLGKGSLLIADGLIFLWSDQGKLTLAEASPEGFRQLGQVQIFEEGRTWTPPALADGRLYLRNLTEIVCLDLKG